jgi:hypothetical protein
MIALIAFVLFLLVLYGMCRKDSYTKDEES